MENKSLVNAEKLHEEVKKEFSDYRQFAFGKNMFAMALALVMANAAQALVNKISACILMPIINYSVSATGGNWRNLVFSPVDGLDMEVGQFVGAFLEFLITTVILYILYKNFVKRFDPDAKVTPH